MTKKILAVTFLSLALSACESTGTDNTNAVNSQKPNNQTASTPAPASPTPAASPTALQVKAGEAVKISLNGSVAEATVVSIDEKTGKVTVKLKSDGKAKTVSMSDIVK